MIKNELDKIGTLDKQKNPLATINAVLNRLKEQGKVRDIQSGTNKLWLKQAGPAQAPPFPNPLGEALAALLKEPKKK